MPSTPFYSWSSYPARLLLVPRPISQRLNCILQSVAGPEFQRAHFSQSIENYMVCLRVVVTHANTVHTWCNLHDGIFCWLLRYTEHKELIDVIIDTACCTIAHWFITNKLLSKYAEYPCLINSSLNVLRPARCTRTP